MRQRTADEILYQVVRSYDVIARHFSATRFKIWPWLKELTEKVKSSDNILDVGCGNGRLLDVLPSDARYHGIDVSKELLVSAKQKYPYLKENFKIFDGIHFPFCDSYFDWVFSVAVLHHIPGRDLRKKFFKEINRVLMPGGRAVVTVWDLWHIKFMADWLHNISYKIIGKSKIDWRDMYVPWKNQAGEIVVRRYFHMFIKRELISLAREGGFAVVGYGKKKVGRQANYYLMLKKQ